MYYAIKVVNSSNSVTLNMKGEVERMALSETVVYCRFGILSIRIINK